MEKIILDNVLPAVFAGTTPGGEVWQHTVTFEHGTRYQVIAASGTGKSTLCAYLYGYRNDYTGKVYIDNADARTLDIDRWCDLRTHCIAYVPQDLRLFGTLTAIENCEIKSRLTGYRSVNEIKHMLASVGLGERMSSRVDHLSIGQQQRVAIVRALCQPFDFLIMDEPVSHLDEETNAAVATLIEQELSHTGAGVVCTSVGNRLLMHFDKSLNL